MKMQDVFDLPIRADWSKWTANIIDNNGFVVIDQKNEVKAAALAINSHDALVEALELIVQHNAIQVESGKPPFLPKDDLLRAQAALNKAR